MVSAPGPPSSRSSAAVPWTLSLPPLPPPPASRKSDALTWPLTRRVIVPVGVCTVTVLKLPLMTQPTPVAPTGRRSILSMPVWKSLIVSIVAPEESPTLR